MAFASAGCTAPAVAHRRKRERQFQAWQSHEGRRRGRSLHAAAAPCGTRVRLNVCHTIVERLVETANIVLSQSLERDRECRGRLGLIGYQLVGIAKAAIV